jgi:hypothetical protein
MHLEHKIRKNLCNGKHENINDQDAELHELLLTLLAIISRSDRALGIPYDHTNKDKFSMYSKTSITYLWR